jgi:prepilin-type N-terminal cleavage/methylation domain-containing protein
VSLKILNKKGFTAIETMLAVIMVAIIAFVGYYVYHAQSQSNKTLASATQVASSSPAQGSTKQASTTTVKYLDIKELGVKFQLSDKISDAYYAVDPNGYYYFSVHSFDSNAELSGCAATTSDGSGVVALVIAKPGEPNGDFAGDDWTLQSIQQAGLKQVGDTYYGFQKGNGPCWDPTAPDATNSADEVSNVIQAFVAATPTFTAD